MRSSFISWESSKIPGFIAREILPEWIQNFVGFVLFTGVGIVFAITWTAAQSNSTGEKARNYDAALTMSAFCIMNSIVYFTDFIFAKRARNMYLAEEAGRW